MTLSATVTASTGGPLNEGSVTFTVSNPSGVSVTATGTVSNGTASAALTLPAGFAAGSYSINASYADSKNANGSTNYGPSTTLVPGSLTVQTAATQTSVVMGASSVQYNANAQVVTATATVTSPAGGAVNQGFVTFSLAGVPSVTVAVNSNGQATAGLRLPPGYPLGSYTVTAAYSDSTNVNGTINFAPSSGAATLTVTQAVTTPVIRQVLILPMGNFAVELITALVTSPGGAVNGGTMSFNLDGRLLSAPISSGQASVMTILPLPYVSVPQQLNLSYNSPNVDFANGLASNQMMLTFLNALNDGFVLFGANGTEIVTTLMNGIPVGIMYDGHGDFSGVAIGILPILPFLP